MKAPQLPPASPVNPEVAIVSRRVYALYEQQRDYLQDKPTAVIEELRHRAEEALHSPDFSVRTAAEINRAACVIILEKRKVQSCIRKTAKSNGRQPSSRRVLVVNIRAGAKASRFSRRAWRAVIT